VSHPVPLVVYVHRLPALAARLLGAVQRVRGKSTPGHRVMGRIRVVLKATAAVTSLWMPAFMRLHWVHVFTLPPGRLLGDFARKGCRAR
jgi:uncharacterized membrane protein